MAKVAKYEDVVINTTGDAQVGATVAVYDEGTLTLASIFSDEVGTPLTNPVTADGAGRFNFYADPNDYDLQVTKGALQYTLFDVTIGYPMFNNVGVLGGQTLIGGTAAGDDLVLQSTSNASKGSIKVGASLPANGDGTFHVHTASAGAVTAVPAADDLVIENSGDVGLSLLGPTANSANIRFGDPGGGPAIGGITYFLPTHANANQLHIFTSAALQAIITTTGIAHGGHVPAATFDGDQDNTGGGIPVLKLRQQDVSENFIQFQGSAAAAVLTQSIVDVGDVASFTAVGYVKIIITDDGNQVTDGPYYLEFGTLA